MTTKTDVIYAYLQKMGYAQPDYEYRSHILRFKSWYKGHTKDFHEYTVTTALKTQRKLHRYSLGMAKLVCEDLATLLLNERVAILSQAFPDLEKVLKRNKFQERGNRLIEWAMALGTGAFVEFLDAKDRPTINYIRGDSVYPLNWDEDNVTECAFGSACVIGTGKTAVRGYYIQIHELDGADSWVIKNVWLDENGVAMPPQPGIDPVSKPSPVPLFQIIRPSIVNSIDPDSPLGMSVFGAAIDQLKSVDMVYDSYVNEYQLGKKRIMVPQTFAQMKLQEDGTFAPFFDPNDLVYHVYQIGDQDKDKLSTVDTQLRSEDHNRGLQMMMDLCSKKCGLGAGRYKFNSQGGEAKTAAEVISKDSDLYQSIKRHEKTLESALIGMVQALASLSGVGSEVEVSVDFDDSIFEDKDAIINKNIKLKNASLTSTLKAVMEIFNMTKEDALALIAEIRKEQMVTAEDVETVMNTAERVVKT